MFDSVHIENKTLVLQDQEGCRTIPLFSQEAFSILSSLWLKVGWNERYHYTFSWMGVPVLQLPEDLLRLQEVIWELSPDWIIETGVAMGGSLLFYASLCKSMGKGKVIGIDIDLHPGNRLNLEKHPLSPFIRLEEGGSTNQELFQRVKSAIGAHERVFVILDSNHTKHHVLQELNLYSSLVTPGSFLVAADGIKKELWDAPRGKQAWKWDNPSDAVQEFLKEHVDFELAPPERCYNRSSIRENVTHFKHAWLRKR